MEVNFNAVELGEPAFGEAPERLDAVDMHTPTARELMLAMVNAQVAVVTDIDEAVIAAPAVGVNHAFERDTPLNNGLQGNFFAVGHDLSVHSSMPLKDAKYWLLECASAALQLHFIATNPAASEVAFIQLNLAAIGVKLFHLACINRLPKQPVITVDRLAI